MPNLNPATTALILIDLQNGIAGLPLQPITGSDVVTAAAGLADRFRIAGASVVLVNVAFSADFGDALRQPVDHEMPSSADGLPAGWSDLVAGLAQIGDIRVTKHQWGAFYGTDLDVHLRRRGITTIVLGGITTNMGVESTARQAHEHGYAVIIARDVTTSFTKEMHTFAIDTMLPMIARVADAANIVLEAAQ